MLSHSSGFKRPNLPRNRRNQRGLALLLVLLTLLILSAIGLGMMYMSDTEAAVNTNYRDSQLAFFAMRAGLEEVRDRMRSGAYQTIVASLPTAMPGSLNSILYIRNPSAGETVDPKTFSTTTFFDDEFCHESFTGSGVTQKAPTSPCNSTGDAPPSGSVAPYITSYDPNTGTNKSIKFKWARITLKQNGTIYNGKVDNSQPAGTQICFQTLANQEIPLSLVPGGAGYASCAAANAAGLDASPVYIVTSLAVTPNGSRRIGQYEVANYTFLPPGGALGLDGSNVNITNPGTFQSNQFTINGHDAGVAGAGWGGPGTCSPAGTTMPAISTAGAPGVTTVDANIPANRINNYTGTGYVANTTPSVVNEGGAGGTYTGEWASPSDLDNLVNALANRADVSYNSCWSSACSPTSPVGLGTNANPVITFVDGNFTIPGGTAGAGVLIVTGTLTMTGASPYNGLILVVGQGTVVKNGGGNGMINGTVFVAKTHSSPGPGTELAALGTPNFEWTGGGSSGIQYNSCWTNIGNISNYTIVDMREEMY